MITEDYVSFETAKLLKEKGFDEGCRRYWYKGKLVFSGHEIWNRELDNYYEDKAWTAPTLQMVMKWLREEKHIPIEILWHYDSNSDVEEWYFTHHAEFRILPNDIKYYETYEEACEAAIKYCLENLI